jgi:hypothetical protein
MTIDERTEKLGETLARQAERHDALAQTVELLVAQVISINTQVSSIGQSIHELIRITQSHELRIQRLEP